MDVGDDTFERGQIVARVDSGRLGDGLVTKERVGRVLFPALGKDSRVVGSHVDTLDRQRRTQFRLQQVKVFLNLQIATKVFGLKGKK